MTARCVLRAAGVAAFGSRWQVPLARSLGQFRPTGHQAISDRQVRRWVAGTTPVPAWALSSLPGMLNAEADAHAVRVTELRRASAVIAADIEGVVP